MKPFDLKNTLLIPLAVFAVLTSASAPAHALDGYQDRRGLFWGMGFGGGGIVLVPPGDMGGHILFDLQLGAGVTQNLTLNFDTDVLIGIFEGQRNYIFTPGPEVNYFFGSTGFFVRGGIGAAMSIVNVNNTNDFSIGFDAGVGFGYEFFANSNLSLGAAVETDYILRQGDDVVWFGFMVGLKYY
jgi:hypothetical protein